MNTDFTCAQCHDLLPGYVAGMLPDAESASVTRHLSLCARCNAELAQWRRLADVAHQIDVFVPNAGFAIESATWAAIQAQLPSESPFASGARLMEFDSRHDDSDLTTSRATPAHAERRPRRRTTFLASVAAILLVTLGAAVFALHPAKHTTDVGGKITPTPTSASVAANLTSPLSRGPHGVAILSANDVWALSDNGMNTMQSAKGLIMHFDGSQWQINATFAGVGLIAISMDSATDGWAVGDEGTTSYKPFFAHFTGGHWVPVTISDVTFHPYDVQMLSASDGYALGWGDSPEYQPAIAHYNNGIWKTSKVTVSAQAFTSAPVIQPLSAIPSNIPNIEQFQMLSDTDGWAQGTYQNKNVVFRYHDSRWIVSYEISSDVSSIYPLGANSPADVWVNSENGTGTLLHFDGNGWHTVSLTTHYSFGGPFYAGAQWLSAYTPGTSTKSGVLAGVLHNQNGQWSLTTLPAGISSVINIASQPDGSALALVVNNFASTFAGVHLLRYSGGVWSVVK